MVDYNYYLGPWTKDTDGVWVPPEGSVGSLDLGSLPDITAEGSTRQVGFFYTPAETTLPEGYTHLGRGDCRELATDGLMRSAWESVTGIAVAGDHLVDLLWYHLTDGADADGETACKPLMPTANNQLELWLPGHSLVRVEGFQWGVHPHHPKVQDVVWKDLLALRARARGGGCRRPLLDQDRKLVRDEVTGKWKMEQDDKFHRRYAMSLQRKFRIRNWDDMKPRGWPAAETPLPHDTTLTESFNTGDSDTLGPDLTWSEVFGDADVVSNKARPGALSAVGGARAESDVSSADHYCKAACYLTGSGIKQNGPAARFDASAVTCYWTRVNSDTPNNGLRLYKFITGTQTQVGSSTTVSGTTYNGTLKTECNGSTIKSIDGTTDKVTATDTSISSGTRGGFRIYNGGSNLADVTFDAYEIGDLSAPAGNKPLGALLGVGS